MTSTEAHELVLSAAREFVKSAGLPNRMNRDYMTAIHMVEVKTARMRGRLNKQRAKRAQDEITARGMPAWLERATR